MPKSSQARRPPDAPARVRRGYFECRYGQLHMHHAMPAGGGFEEGMALLCVHEFSGSGRVFSPLLALAGCERSVYAPDLPGFGESDPPTSAFALGDYAGALMDFLDTMRLRSVAVLGLRSGGLLACELAAARPANVARLLLLGAPALDPGARQAGSVPAAQPQAWALQAARDYPLRARVAKLTQPLLVLRAQDEPAESASRTRELLPAARSLELRQPAAQLFEPADALGAAVREFLHVT